MNENVYSKLKYSCIIWIIIYGFFSSIFDIIVYRVVTGLEEVSIIGMITIFGIVVFSNYSFIKYIVCFINPNNNPIASKYGGVENLKFLVEEINRTEIYKDNKVIISNDYISLIKSYKKIIHLDDVINAFQFVQKTNGLITSRDLVIIVKSGKEVHFRYGDNEESILSALKTLSKVRDDINIGYIR